MMARASYLEDTHAQIDRNLTYRPPTPDTVKVHEFVRDMVLAVAHQLVEVLPPGRHAVLAQTALQETLLWANAAIACDTPSAPLPNPDA